MDFIFLLTSFYPPLLVLQALKSKVEERSTLLAPPGVLKDYPS